MLIVLKPATSVLKLERLTRICYLYSLGHIIDISEIREL